MIFNNKICWLARALLYKPFLGSIGTLSYIGRPLFISGYRKIFFGKKIRIYPNSRIEVLNESFIIFEDNISIGQNFHIISGGSDGLIIGKDTMISANVFITNINHSYQKNNQIITDQPLIICRTKIGENCFIGYGAVIQAGTILGKQCVVGANAVVRGVFPDYSVIVGVPARIVKRYNEKTKRWDKTNERGDFENES